MKLSEEYLTNAEDRDDFDDFNVYENDEYAGFERVINSDGFDDDAEDTDEFDYL